MTGIVSQEPLLEPCDIVLTRGRGLLSRLIRFLTRSIGEARTKVNHVGIVTVGGPLSQARIIEALSNVVERPLLEEYGDGNTEVAVFRPLNLSSEEKAAVVATARSYLNRTYGYGKLLLHLLDWFFLGVYFFRRVGGSRYPICSWLVAHAFKGIGKHFGVKVGEATPDDIWDFVTAEEHREKYRCVRALTLVIASSAEAAERSSQEAEV